MSKLLEVKNLRVSYHTYAGEVQSVRGVSFDLDEGEAIAVVGESGCGKSVTAKTIMGLIKDPGEIKEGSEIIYRGQDILKLSKKEMSQYRGKEAAIIFQDALAALNPTMRVGKQIMENILQHNKSMSKQEAFEEAVKMLEMVGIPGEAVLVDLLDGSIYEIPPEAIETKPGTTYRRFLHLPLRDSPLLLAFGNFVGGNESGQ